MRAALALLLLLGGCGFRPIYAPRADTTQPSVAAELSSIQVPVMPDRAGMLMRQALQERLGRFGEASPHYTLAATYAISAEGDSIDQYSNVTRIRYVGLTDWVLREQSSGHIITSGHSRVIDATNVFNSEFFSTTQGMYVAYKQMADQLADQVVAQLGAWFANPPPG